MVVGKGEFMQYHANTNTHPSHKQHEGVIRLGGKSLQRKHLINA